MDGRQLRISAAARGVERLHAPEQPHLPYLARLVQHETAGLFCVGGPASNADRRNPPHTGGLRGCSTREWARCRTPRCSTGRVASVARALFDERARLRHHLPGVRPVAPAGDGDSGARHSTTLDSAVRACRTRGIHGARDDLPRWCRRAVDARRATPSLGVGRSVDIHDEAFVAAFALAGLLALVAYGPVIAASGMAPLVSNRFVTPVSTPRFIALLPDFITDLRATLGLGVSAALGAVFIVAAIVAVALPREGRACRATLVGAAALWCVFVLVLTRRPPPARVWLSIVPLGCIVAGSGLAMLLQLLSARRLVAASSLLLCIGIATHTYRQRIIFDSPETNLFGLRDAEQIARFAVASLRPGDQLVAVGLTTAPLEYYLLAIAGRRLDDVATATKSGRILVVVNQRHHQTFASVTQRRRDVPWTAFAPPGLLRQFSDATVYEVTMPSLVVNDTSAANHPE